MSTHFPFGSNDLQEKLPFADQVRKPSDICRRKHQGNAQSEQANEQAEPKKLSTKKRIWIWVNQQSRHGATVEEISNAMHLRYTTVSARVSELRRDGRLIPDGRERKTETGSPAAVLLTDYWFGNQTEARP